MISLIVYIVCHFRFSQLPQSGLVGWKSAVCFDFPWVLWMLLKQQQLSDFWLFLSKNGDFLTSPTLHKPLWWYTQVSSLYFFCFYLQYFPFLLIHFLPLSFWLKWPTFFKVSPKHFLSFVPWNVQNSFKAKENEDFAILFFLNHCWSISIHC